MARAKAVRKRDLNFTKLKEYLWTLTKKDVVSINMFTKIKLFMWERVKRTSKAELIAMPEKKSFKSI